MKSGSLNLLEPPGPVQAWSQMALPFMKMISQGQPHKLKTNYNVDWRWRQPVAIETTVPTNHITLLHILEGHNFYF
jgi:hypothetical protein